MRKLLLFCSFLVFPNLAKADPMPPPHGASGPVFMELGGQLVPTGYYRPSDYEHWQYRSVNSFGQWRPRSVYYQGSAWRVIDGSPVPAPHSYPGILRP